jgi:DNA-binding LacI/PurR family transcriptional regulator
MGRENERNRRVISEPGTMIHGHRVPFHFRKSQLRPNSLRGKIAGSPLFFQQALLVKSYPILSAPEQVARHLKEQIAQGKFTGFMPGGAALAREFGIGRTTADAALDILQAEGILANHGHRKRRRIIPDALPSVAKPMQVGMILYEPSDAANQYVPEIRQLLLSSGFNLNLSPKTLIELNHNPAKVEKMVQNNPADAWVVVAGSRPVLKWFSVSSIPSFALFGRMQGLPMPGIKPDKLPAMRDALKTLIEMGHRRIVLLVREERRKPSLGNVEKTFLEQLEKHGIQTGHYNIPDWKENPAGLRACLEKLFGITPPTAIFVGDSVLFLAVQNFLKNSVPKLAGKVALVSTDYHPHMDWCNPPLPHFAWNHRTTARRILKWLQNLQRGKPDHGQAFAPTKFIPGNIGNFDLLQ